MRLAATVLEVTPSCVTCCKPPGNDEASMRNRVHSLADDQRF